MSTTLLASLSFDFKGKTISIAERIDLNSICDHGYEAIYNQLARTGGIGPYSYEFEVLLDQPLQFSEADSDIAPFVAEDELDLEGFKRWKQKRQVMAQLEEIASRCLAVESLESEPKLRQALFEAWDAGRTAD